MEVGYIESFGVCGTGLESEEITLAGEKASVGTYDEHEFWDFISFTGENEHIVALTSSVESWWPEYDEQVMEILDTLKFERESADSKIEQLGLSLEMKNITPTGATLVFQQADGNPTGTLQFGDDFIIEKQEKGEWKAVSVVVEGNYGFHDLAYPLENDSMRETEADWEWLYGKLEPGEYRIGKSVHDFRETGDYDQYMIYGHFVLE